MKWVIENWFVISKIKKSFIFFFSLANLHYVYCRSLYRGNIEFRSWIKHEQFNRWFRSFFSIFEITRFFLWKRLSLSVINHAYIISISVMALMAQLVAHECYTLVVVSSILTQCIIRNFSSLWTNCNILFHFDIRFTFGKNLFLFWGLFSLKKINM